MKTLLLSISISCILVSEVYAQSSVRDLENYMVKLRKSPHESMPESILKDETNEGKLLAALKPFLADTMDVIQRKAFYITKRIGQKSKNDAVQQQAVNVIVTLIKVKDTGLSGNAIEALTGFKKKNFSTSAKDSIASALRPSTAHLGEVVKLVGFLEMRDQIGSLNALLQGNLNLQDKWAARLSLARLGEEDAINWIVKKLESAKVNDDFVYDIVPELVYTRQLSIFKFLEKIIKSDEEGCQSANPDSSKKILCGYRVMENVAPHIQGFPLKTDASGDLMVSDYKSALLEVRDWFSVNQNYTILTDTY